MAGYTKNLKELFKINKSERFFEASIKSSFVNIFARGFGYAKSVVIAILLGFSYQTDAFFEEFKNFAGFLFSFTRNSVFFYP